MATPAIIGTGSALPATVRTNDDPIFDWLRSQPQGPVMFTGYVDRRVLGPTETIAGLMAQAAQAALKSAGVEAGDVDAVLGSASFGTWLMPNDLVTMATQLDVPPSALIMPINSEYAIFQHALVAAEGLLTTGRATTVLIVVGADWTRWVNYHTPQSISAGDGAGAVVMQLSDDPSKWVVRDMAVASAWQYFGGMFVAPDPVPPATPPAPPTTFGPAYFHISNDLGRPAFMNFGVPVPPRLVQQVLDRNGLAAADVALVCHQTSTTLLDPWKTALPVGAFIETLAALGNMTAASIPVNLDLQANQAALFDHLVLVALGPEPSCTVTLLARNQGG